MSQYDLSISVGSANQQTLESECVHPKLVRKENLPLCNSMTAQAEVTVSVVIKLFVILVGLAAVALCHQDGNEPAGMPRSHNKMKT